MKWRKTLAVYIRMGHLCLLDHFISTSKSVVNMSRSVSFQVSSQRCNNWATSSFSTYLSWQPPCENSRLVSQRKLRYSCALAYVTGKVKRQGFKPEFHHLQAQRLFLPVSITPSNSFSLGTWIRLLLYSYCICLSSSSHIPTLIFFPSQMYFTS